MSKIDKVMNKYSVLKNLQLPAGPIDGSQRAAPTTGANPFNWGNWGKLPDKLFAPWSDPTPKEISTYIAPVQFQRLRHDVNMWREAIREAELTVLPFRVRMQRMYVDTVLNPHVQACLLRRKNLTLLREFELVDESGNVDEDATEMFRQKWFFDFVSFALDAMFYGYSLIQLGEVQDDLISDIDLVRRFNISPDRRCVTVFEYAVTGISFDDPAFAPYLVWVPTPSEIGISHTGYGLLYKIANIELFHRQAMQHNADFCEMFVHPFRLAKTNKTQKDADYKQLVSMMQQMGSQSWGILNQDDTMEWLKMEGTGYQAYSEFRKSLEGLISKVLLGHQDALDSTPGKLGAGEGEESPAGQALEEIQLYDGRFIQHVVNYSLMPKVRGLGLDIPQGLKLRFKNDAEVQEEQDRRNQATLVLGQALVQLKQAGFSIDLEQLKEMTGLELEYAQPMLDADEPQVQTDLERVTNISNRLRLLYNHNGHRHGHAKKAIEG